MELKRNLLLDDMALIALMKKQGYVSPEFSKNGRKKKKKKGKKADDLRFKDLDSVVSTGSRRKDRKKKLLEAKKKKLEEAQTEENMDFHGHEQIKFGDVVEAPPKHSRQRVPRLLHMKGSAYKQSKPIGNLKDGNQGLGSSFHHL